MWLISALGSHRAAFPFIRNAVSRHLMNVCPIFLAVWLLWTAEITISSSPPAKRCTMISSALLVVSRCSFGAEQENSGGLLEPFCSSERGHLLCLKNQAKCWEQKMSGGPSLEVLIAGFIFHCLVESTE